MSLDKYIEESKKNFVKETNYKDYMDVDFLITELCKDTKFMKYLIYIVLKCNVPYNQLELTTISMKKYCETFKQYSDELTEVKRKGFLISRTKFYNTFILFLITQLKLIAKDEEFFAILLAVEQFKEQTILGSLFKRYDITREKLIEFDQEYRLQNLIIKSKKAETDESENIEEIGEENTTKEEELAKFYTDYSLYLKENKPHKIIGKKKEIELIEQSLFRKNKCGVVLVGKSGVGKDEIVNGFTAGLKNGKFFKDYTVIKLNTTAFSEVNVFKGHLEYKIREVLTFLSSFSDVILYIEDLHTLFNKIRVDDDIAHALLPQIMKFKMKCIATCDYADWTSIVEDNTQLAKYFQKILVNEASTTETETIIRKNIKSYENYYGIQYDKSVPETLVTLADKYMFNKCFPEKAFDLLDIVSSKFKYNTMESEDKTLSSSELMKLFGEINEIPLDDLKDEDLIDFKKIANNLKDVVISQDEAIDRIMNHIAINKAGLREDNKTVCNIFLKAQSGVGKTFLCQELAKQLHVKLIRFDMSEYSEQHSVAKFLGTPPGYVGFSDANHGSLLISALEQNPRCVLLLDEIEKANETIHNVLLQAMDNGKITSTTGKEVSLKEVILVMTSNVGATATDAIAFGESSKDNAMEHMDQIFKPEFKTRLDDIITMNPVSKIDVKKVIEIELGKIKPMIKKYKKKLSWSKEVVKYIEEQVLNNNLGLRIVKHIIDTEIKIQIVENLNKKGNLTIQLENNNLKVKLCS